MSRLDASLIQDSLADASLAPLDQIEVFASIDSTNTHLLSQPTPEPGRYRVALADHQTAGRGRHNRRWLAPPGASLCLSVAYTFADQPQQLPALTLAVGVGIVSALRAQRIGGVSLKWPNDIVALDSKLGGVLTEVHASSGEGVTVVTGIGLNIVLPEDLDFGAESAWAHRPIDLASVQPGHPQRELLAAELVCSMHAVMTTFEEEGFAAFLADWSEHDWLRGREITVDLDDRQVFGVAAGVDADGALLVDCEQGQTRVISGSILLAGLTGSAQ